MKQIQNSLKLQRTIQVVIMGSQGQTSCGTVEHRVWEKRERTLRGLKALGIAWGIAIGAILIPLLHFVLVPLFLLAGPVAFFWTARQEEVILGGKGECPDCKLEFQIVQTAVKWPISDVCNHCHSQVKIERASAPENKVEKPSQAHL